MTKVQRYAVTTIAIAWLLGNLPAWLFLPTFTEHKQGHTQQTSYALYYSMLPLFVGIFGLFTVIAWSNYPYFKRWLVGEQERELRAERIERMERELGIGE